MEFFAWFEGTPLSIWVRESPLVFPTILIAHALGMGCLVGVNVFIGLRAVGVVAFPSAVKLSPFISCAWLGFTASAISGALLLAAYPAKALTNPVFYLKFALIAAALIVLRKVLASARADSPAEFRSVRVSGCVLLILWAAAISAGRFLAYTHEVLLASHLVSP